MPKVLFTSMKEFAIKLLDRRADATAADDSGTIILMWATGNGHEKIGPLLLHQGARILAVGRFGVDAPGLVFRREHETLAQFRP